MREGDNERELEIIREIERGRREEERQQEGEMDLDPGCTDVWKI